VVVAGAEEALLDRLTALAAYSCGFLKTSKASVDMIPQLASSPAAYAAARFVLDVPRRISRSKKTASPTTTQVANFIHLDSE
jgi:hypothetical protein